MDRLGRLATFVRIVEDGTLSLAARHSGLTVPAVSKQLRALEQQLGVQLVRRSTRALAVTEAGATLYQRARRLLADFHETLDAAASAGETSAATLCIAGEPGVLRAVVLPTLAELLPARPRLRIELRPWTDRGGQLPPEADLAIVSGRVDDTPLRIARPLSRAPRVLCASRAYLASRQAPEMPGDLAGHPCLLQGTLGRAGAWELLPVDTGLPATAVLVDGPLRLCSDDAVWEAALLGLGIALLPRWLVAEDIAEGRLLRLLPGFTGPPALLCALYAREHARAPRLTPLLEALTLRFRAGEARPAVGRRSA